MIIKWDTALSGERREGQSTVAQARIRGEPLFVDLDFGVERLTSRVPRVCVKGMAATITGSVRIMSQWMRL